MSNKKLLSELFDELEKIVKIDASYFEELTRCGVNENEAWIRAMAKFFLEIDDSFESIHIIRDVIYDEYCLKDRKEHSRHFETHGEYLLENVEKKTVQALKKLNIDYKVDSEIFNSFSDEDLKNELERREKAESQEPDLDLDFDDGLDIEVQDLELKLLSNDDLDDFDELDFDDDDLDFDDDDELKKAELDDLKVDNNSVFLDYLAFEGMDSLIDDTECDDELLDDELSLDDDDEDLSVVSLFKVNGNTISFADYKEETVNDDILELIGSLSKDEIGTVYSIKVNGIDYYYSKYDTTALIHIFRYLRDLNPKSQYNTHIYQIGENYKKSVLTMIMYLDYINEFYAENKQEPFKIVKKDMCENLSFGNNDWHNQIMNWLIKCGYIKTKSYNRYVITDLGFDVINTEGLKVKYLEPWIRYRMDKK
ncbi:hypothetical protein J7911_22580 [Vibrio parahaemolyticus]|uniref:hypothetical protein n=1 Tax=Vibrio parahaemolyticus TaxID=670 RepID=UPI00084B2D0F|nr:hypothetical protein [Vibrio parahaemolyticus]MBM5391735.1 hypothetical protein [Vibrio parahaemolyticus]MBM5409340.1 hypothetical protein [Vibrio parahaemolyticus]MCF9670885.1 hypothetical protein [Vibrio parahaemolyticus]MCF9764003.1 hypothetical protein [Vibrio parahaemolyticus]MCF9813632.1 hypothetical protein [Vibrio parahaemolyticus]